MLKLLICDCFMERVTFACLWVDISIDTNKPLPPNLYCPLPFTCLWVDLSIDTDKPLPPNLYL